MESRIKERLTGALILVAALVILVPEIFSGRRAAEPARDAPLAAPATEGPPIRSYTAELDAAAPAPVAPAAAPPAVTEPAPAPVEPPPAQPVSPPPQQVAQQVPQQARSAVEPAPPEAAAAGDWYVQVGSFSQAENAQRYARQLRAQGFTVIVLPPAGSKSLSRVRVGPARTREAAGSLLDRLQAGGHKGAVVGP